jgi:hypothetical protein
VKTNLKKSLNTNEMAFSGRQRLLLNLVLVLFTCIFAFQSQSNAFDGADLENPRIDAFRLETRPTKDTDWEFLFVVSVSDDKNLIQVPKFTFTLAWPWKSAVNPPPKCQTVDKLTVPVSVIELINERNLSATRPSQTFIAFGRIPPIPSLPQGCLEFRDTSNPPVVAINGKGISTSRSKQSNTPIYSGGIFEPQIEDFSGRKFTPSKPAILISSKDLAITDWPKSSKVPCLTQSDAKLVVEQASAFSTLEQELLRAESLESSKTNSLPAVRLLFDGKQIAQKLIDLEQMFLANLKPIPFCESAIKGNQFISSLKSSVSQIKKINDSVERARKLESDAAIKAARVQETIAQSAKLKSLDGEISKTNLTYSDFLKDFQSLTSNASSQTSKVGSGKPAQLKKNRKTLETNQEEFREKVDQGWQKLKELEEEIIEWETSNFETIKVNSRSFEAQYMKKLLSLRDSQKKTILLLMKFEYFYRSKLL